FYAAVATAVLVFASCRYATVAKLPPTLLPYVDNAMVGADFWTARLTAIKVIGKYLWLLVWPARLSCDYSFNHVSLSGWSDPAAWLAMAVITAILSTVVLRYRRDRPV